MAQTQATRMTQIQSRHSDMAFHRRGIIFQNGWLVFFDKHFFVKVKRVCILYDSPGTTRCA